MLFNILIVITLVVLSGVFAGLTLALFSIKLSTLETRIRLGDREAEKVYEIRKNGNRLLVTLLLGNVASYTVMAVFLGSITSGVIAGFVATALIFVFGEILPQAVFPRFAMTIGARLDWLVKGLLFLFYPVSAPVAWVLDKMLGKETPVLWSKEELGEIIRYHEDVGDGIIDEDEERIILGALSFSELTVADVMIPREKVFYLNAQDVIDENALEKIRKKGFTRVPILDGGGRTITGVLFTKNLIGVDPGTTAGDLCSSANMIKVSRSKNLDGLLNLLTRRRMHMAFAVDRSGTLLGVVTLEDIMEKILKTEIDERKG